MTRPIMHDEHGKRTSSVKAEIGIAGLARIRYKYDQQVRLMKSCA